MISFQILNSTGVYIFLFLLHCSSPFSSTSSSSYAPCISLSFVPPSSVNLFLFVSFLFPFLDVALVPSSCFSFLFSSVHLSIFLVSLFLHRILRPASFACLPLFLLNSLLFLLIIFLFLFFIVILVLQFSYHFPISPFFSYMTFLRHPNISSFLPLLSFLYSS